MYTPRRSTYNSSLTLLISVAQHEPQFAIDRGGGGPVDDLDFDRGLRSRGILHHDGLRRAADDGGNLGGDRAENLLLGCRDGATLFLRRQQPLGGARLPLVPLVAHEGVDGRQVLGGAAAEAVGGC